MSTVIDAHHHFWLREGRSTPWDYAWQDAPELSPIRRSFGPADLEPLIDAAGVDRTVFVHKCHEVERCKVTRGVVEEHVLGTWIRCTDRTTRFTRMPALNCIIVLYPRVATNPCRLRHRTF